MPVQTVALGTPSELPAPWLLLPTDPQQAPGAWTSHRPHPCFSQPLAVQHATPCRGVNAGASPVPRALTGMKTSIWAPSHLHRSEWVGSQQEILPTSCAGRPLGREKGWGKQWLHSKQKRTEGRHAGWHWRWCSGVCLQYVWNLNNKGPAAKVTVTRVQKPSMDIRASVLTLVANANCLSQSVNVKDLVLAGTLAQGKSGLQVSLVLINFIIGTDEGLEVTVRRILAFPSKTGLTPSWMTGGRMHS